MVVKADGLAAGKGVIVAASTEEACSAVDYMLVNKAFGSAGECAADKHAPSLQPQHCICAVPITIEVCV